MKTELDQQTQTQDALTNAQAISPYALNPQQGTVIPSFYEQDDIWREAAKSAQLVNPPSVEEIDKQMWIGSFMTALMVGLTTGDAGAAIAGGLWGAIAIHDGGYSLRKRAEHVPQLQKDGYSAQSILQWYETGDQKGLDAERDDMLARDKFNEQNLDDVRDFKEGQRRYNENQQFRDEQAARNERYRNENLGLRREGLNQRKALFDQKQQMIDRQLKQQQRADTASGMSLRDQAQAIASGIDPATGKAPTAARIKQSNDWKQGNLAYSAGRNGLVSNLAQVDKLLSLDVSEGTGAVAGYLPAWMNMIDAQQVRGLIGNLKSQEFMRGIQGMKGMGALSEKEGQVVQGLIAQLDPQSSPEQLMSELGQIRDAILRGLNAADNEADLYQYDMPVAPVLNAQQPEPQGKPAEGGETRTSSGGVTYKVKEK
ncbi:hypothetical protein [Pluralibacter sp.]|uniref:hypothetical protein n=1 Tax=Pluralibacter sp. TaxID=1920032 RepID=UPI0025E0E5A8|nr:hypothetical protein [Pluralibacter sp.]MBV8042376.1 hypothetical protein [Pluralibacter sp.]